MFHVCHSKTYHPTCVFRVCHSGGKNASCHHLTCLSAGDLAANHHSKLRHEEGASGTQVAMSQPGQAASSNIARWQAAGKSQLSAARVVPSATQQSSDFKTAACKHPTAPRTCSLGPPKAGTVPSLDGRRYAQCSHFSFSPT